jgi:hypothetical protein
MLGDCLFFCREPVVFSDYVRCCLLCRRANLRDCEDKAGGGRVGRRDVYFGILRLSSHRKGKHGGRIWLVVCKPSVRAGAFFPASVDEEAAQAEIRAARADLTHPRDSPEPQAVWLNGYSHRPWGQATWISVLPLPWRSCLTSLCLSFLPWGWIMVLIS